MMMAVSANRSIPRLYLLTDQSPLPILLARLEAALATGVVGLLQIRRKNTETAILYQESLQIIDLCQNYGVAVVMNDDIKLAKQLRVGVHLGQQDGSVVQARKILGTDAIIGVTCHDSLVLAMQAAQAGASYVAFGAMFASVTKPSAKTAVLAKLQLMSLVDFRQQGLDVCVIGGITLDNVSLLKNKLQGFAPTYIAVSDDVFAATNVAVRVGAWGECLADWLG